MSENNEGQVLPQDDTAQADQADDSFDDGWDDGEEDGGQESKDAAAQSPEVETDKPAHQEGEGGVDWNIYAQQSAQDVNTDVQATHVKKDIAPVVSIPSEIQGEFEELKKLSAEAALVAQEDSPDGEAIRNRLANYGAASALDRADIISDRRNVEKKAAKEQEAAVKGHNTYFDSVLQREVPDIVAMSRDTKRAPEAAQFHKDMDAWIKSKPYAEAEPMLNVFNAGRDPHAVAALVKQFQKERKLPNAGNTVKSVDSALAVPRRGGPVSPAGIGDANDFDAGFNIGD